jgi:YD repeat-containing protein
MRQVAGSLLAVCGMLALFAGSADAASWSSGWDSRALGASDGSHPSWSRGPLSVSLVSGNLRVAFPGPSFPTPSGAIELKGTFNSAPPQIPPSCSPMPGCQVPVNYSATSRSSQLGSGITFSAGPSDTHRPVMLIDYDKLVAGASVHVVEVVFDDGASKPYVRLGSSNVYYAADQEGQDATDGSMVTVDPGGDGTASRPNWSLVDADGLTAAFGPADSGSGRALVVGMQQQTTSGGGARSLVYTYSPTNSRLLTQIADPHTGRALNLVWNELDASGCPDAILCATGPDGQTWKYIGDGTGGSSGSLARVNDGTRDLIKVHWNAGQIDHVYSANDLDPSNASPGYNATHSVDVAYKSCTQTMTPCFDGSVQSVTEHAVTVAGAATDLLYKFKFIWTNALCNGYCPSTTQAPHGALSAGAVRHSRVWAQITTPLTGIQWYWTDASGQLMQDYLGYGTLSGNNYISHLYQYGSHGELLWSEDGEGNPTDNSYDPVSHLITASQQPDPDGAGPVGRPTTTHRYDEQTIGTTGAAGAPMTGLRSAYYSNQHLAGVPTKVQTDGSSSGPAIDHDSSSSGPAALAGRQTDFSARWTGQLHASSAGSYTFSLAADDGMRLIVDGQLLIDDWADGAVTTNTASKTLTTGDHTVEVDYYQNVGTAEIHLSWTPPGASSGLLQSADTTPAYGLATSTISTSGQIAFSHYADPVLGQPDYTQAGGQSLRLLTSFAYDPLGRMTEKALPNANTGRTIDGSGNLQGTADSQYVTNYSYYADTATAAPPAACASGPSVNQAGQLASMSTAGLAQRTFVYDAAGRRIAETKAAGTHCWRYTSEGRLSSERTPTDTAVASCADPQATRCLTYDPSGLMRTATNATSTLTFAYDEAGRLVDTTTTQGGSVTAESTQTYDADDNAESRTIAAGPIGVAPSYTTKYFHSILNDQLYAIREPGFVGGHNYNLYYDKVNRLKDIDAAGVAYSYISRNPTGWITSVYNRHGTGCSSTNNCPITADGNAFADYTYQRDQDSRVTSETRTAGATTTQTKRMSEVS